MSQQNTNDVVGKITLFAIYNDETKTQQTIEQLRDKGVALDMLSALGRVHPSA